MVDVQRLELENKRYRRESLSLFVAVLALSVSAVATWFAVQPTMQEASVRTDATVAYLTALSKAGVNDALGALAYAESGSPAAVFAATVAQWRQAQSEDSATVDVEDGDVERHEDDSFSLCLPKLTVPLFPERCVTIANVDYSQQEEVLNFTIDGIPTASLVRSVSTSDLAEGGEGPMRIFLSAAVVSPDGNSETLVYSLTRKREEDRQYTVTFSPLALQNDREDDLGVLSQYFPPEVGYWEAASAVIQVPRETAFLWVCWGGIQDARGGCDWTYGTGMG
ncbi:MAG TPA: hypothetical protein VIP82_03675 [Microbacterium sp.]|uniref:hypothetical protein n=1 Tax=Microbacterium sp. TaxID=51671 RepID=UPI002F9358C9